MPTPDLLLLDAGANPTEGLEEQAPVAPYVPSSVLDVAGSNFLSDTREVGEWLHKGLAEYGGTRGADMSGTGYTGLPIGGFGEPATFGPEAKVAPEQLKKEFPGVTGIDQPLPRSVVQTMQEEQAAAKKRQEIAERYPTDIGSTLAAAGVGTIESLLDPVNDAAFMVPVVGESRYATWLAKAGESTGWLGRGAVAAGVGAARGAAGGAILAGGKAAIGDPDETLGEIATETLQNAAAGALFHTAFGFRSDVLGERFLESPEGRLAGENASIHDAAVRTAAAQMADDQPVEVRPIFDAAEQERLPGLGAPLREGAEERPDLLGTTALGRSPYLDDAIQRASGQPSQKAVRLEDAAQEAKATPPDKVLQSQSAESDAVIEELRQAGLLTPEDEAQLAAVEPVEEGESEAEAEDAAAAEPAPEPEAPPQPIPIPVLEGAAQDGFPLFQRLVEAAQPAERREQVIGQELRPGEARERVARAAAEAGRIAPGATVQPLARIEASGAPVAGVYFPQTNQGLRHVIAWSLEAPDEVGTVRHEAVHFLKRAGFLTPEEWGTLSQAAEEHGWLGAHDIENRYPDLDREGQVEEAVAEQYSKWNRGKSSVPEFVRPIFERLQSVLRSVGDFLRQTFGLGEGISSQRAADDIFRRIESGEVGRRAPQTAQEGGLAFQRPPTPPDMDEAAQARKRLTAQQDIIKRVKLAQTIDQIHGRGLPIAHGFDAVVRGISENVPGARNSTAQAQLERQNEFMSRLETNLSKTPGALDAFRKRILTPEWTRELSELNKENGHPGITKNPLALKIAQAVHDAQDLARLRLNQSGAWVGDYDGYVSRTQHNAIAIHKAGYDQWKRDVLEGLDQEKTFGDLTRGEQETYLRNVYDALSTGVHMIADRGELGAKAGAFPGPANPARRASAERTLHWKDADAWRAYQAKYGEPNIELGVLNSLQRAGRDAALMDRWGSKPQETFDTLVRQMRESYRSDHAAVMRFDAALPRLKEEFAHLTGEATRPQKELEAKIVSTVREAQDITKLGNVLLAHMSVAATKPFQLQYQGVGRWKAYTSVLRSLVEDKSPEGRQIMENLRANATGQMQHLASGYEARDGIPGYLAQLQRISMRLGGLPWMIARQKAGTRWEVANFLGQQAHLPFDQLNERTQRGLSMHDISPQEWEMLRSAPLNRDASGSAFLTPGSAMKANVDPLVASKLEVALDADHAERIRDEARDRLAMKLASYQGDAADKSTITPGIAEKAFLTRRFGRTWGPAVGQYKTWAMAAVRQMWGQSIHGSSSKAEAVKSLAELVAVGTAIGYARLAMTSGLQGETPELLNGDAKHDVELTMKSMLAGGGLGIFGDYLMGQYARPDENGLDRAKGLALSLLGPTIEDGLQMAGIGWEAASAAFGSNPEHTLGNAGGETMRFVTNHLPFVNIWYLHLLSHWLVLDRLNEMADPGYLQRRQDAIKQRTGQDFFLPTAA